MENSMTIIHLEVENVKRIKALRIAPPATGLVKIAGRNDQGKTSTLDSIMLALAGKRAGPAVPIKKGATQGRVVIQLGSLAVERKWTVEGSSLRVTRDGIPIRRPQEFLDALTGTGIGFDPLTFLPLRLALPAAMRATWGWLAIVRIPVMQGYPAGTLQVSQRTLRHAA